MTTPQTRPATGSDPHSLTTSEPQTGEPSPDWDDDTCSQCAASLDDGEGFDGLCGACADRAENEGRWSHWDS